MTPAEYNARQLTLGVMTVDHVTELVRFWQSSHGLTADAMAGPLTLASIATAGATTAKPAPFLASPLPILPDGRKATITSSFRPPDRPNHDGCDWFYEWRPGDKPDLVGDRGAAGRQADGSPRWVVPYGVLAQAAAAGTVQIAGNSETGHRVWIDHGNGLRTGYFHLLDLRVEVGDKIEAGEPIGLVGDNPKDFDGRHLHFEVSPVDHYQPIDPEPLLLARP